MNIETSTNHFTSIDDEPDFDIGKIFILISFALDETVVKKVGEFGYPKLFIRESLLKYDMNDAATCYFLL